MDTKRPEAERLRGGTYLLTWTTYGSWLPGDDRGFVSYRRSDRGDFEIHNQPNEPYDFGDPQLNNRSRRLQTAQCLMLTSANAQVCMEAFREVGDRHGVDVHAGAIMTTHVHLVVSSHDADGAKLLNLFKGVVSRRLGQRFGAPPGGSWWTRHGSRRLIRDDRAFDNALRYVMEQPSPLLVFQYVNGELFIAPIDTRPPSLSRPL